MNKRLSLTLAAAAAGLIALGAGTQKRITVKGSDTMVILSQRWAEEYMKSRPDVTIQVSGGGSGTGISALINGTTDICNASRPMKEAERRQLSEKYGATGVEIKSAIDGISLFVNDANPVNELSFAQIKGIYTGQITNWKDVGGTDAGIITYGRENSSGTYDFLRERVLGGADYAPSVQSMPGTAAIVNAVVKDPNGIGYGGAAYGKGIKVIKVKKEERDTAYLPSAESIKGGNYPVSRFLLMYTIKKPEGEIKNFIDWTLSDKGQKIVTDVGYFPLR